MTSISHAMNTPSWPVVTHQKHRAPCRKASFLAGRETGFWTPCNRRHTRAIVLAARRYERTTKKFGKRNGALGSVALEIIDYLANLIDLKTGRLEPSIGHIMRRLRRSRDAVVRALKALRDHGFIEWRRRYIECKTPTRAPQRKQTSNAYRLQLPGRAKPLLSAAAARPPIPDDAAWRQDENKRQLQNWLQQLTCEEFAGHLIDDDRLSRTLKKLGRFVDQRESG